MSMADRHTLHAAIVLLFVAVFSAPAFAAPGDTLFDTDFDDGAGCSAFGPDWTTTDANLSAIGTFTANSGSCSLFTRGSIVSTTSRTLDLSSASGADLSFWLQRGDDLFSEDTDAGEDFVVEYIDDVGLWRTLATYLGSGSNGQILLYDAALPAEAFHAGFQLRFRQTGGSGGPPANSGLGWDFWHIDDVLIVETGTAPPPETPSTLGVNICEDFESGFDNWLGDGLSNGVSTATSNSGSSSMFLRNQANTVTAKTFSSVGADQLTLWVRRGGNFSSQSELPDGGENLIVSYFDSTGTWQTLDTFFGGGTGGQIFTESYALPTNARHPDFSVRFEQTLGSGVDFDYWHVDDVCVESAGPVFDVVKTVTPEWDPVNEFTNPYNIPGSWARYRIEVTNLGPSGADAGSITLGDTFDSDIDFFAGDLSGTGSPIIFTDGTGANQSGVSLSFTGLGSGTDGVEFRNGANASITPIADFDPDVRSIAVTFSGAMNAATGGAEPTFAIEFRVRVN
ncbi:MAG: hypothetical protein AAFS03_00990 [Pseudomonadota bacterium]